MKKGKSAGVDNNSSKLVQTGGKDVITAVTTICNKILQTGELPHAEKIIAEEQAGFRAGRSTTEQIFNLRILYEKYIQHQQDLYHVFIDVKKAFRRV